MPENGTMNGRMSTHGRTPRKQLSDQLDRFDNMSDRLDTIIDALAEALPGAVKEACQEGARLAVKEAIIEIFTNPDFRPLFAKMQPEPMPVPSMPPPVTGPPLVPHKPNNWDRMKAKLAALKNGVRNAVVGVKNAVLSRFNAVRQFVATISLAAGEQLHVRRILLTSLCVGLLIGTACWLLPQEVAACLSAVSAACTSVAVQIGTWLRRAARNCGLMA